MKNRVVILANGRFPENDMPLGYLNNTDKIICCDGAVSSLVNYGKEPWAIVGDMDSLPAELRKKYSDRLFPDDGQQTNDLTKSVFFCIENGISNVIILGATGLREDHTLGNISLLGDYAEVIDVKMVTDYGIFIPLISSSSVSSWKGQQVSIFSVNSSARISSAGLKYPLEDMQFLNWWLGTLNESTGDNFEISFDIGPVIIFLKF